MDGPAIVLQCNKAYARGQASPLEVSMIGARGTALALAMGIAWSLASGLAAAQSCSNLRIEISTQESRCVQPGAAEVFKDCPDCPEMVAVPAGDFMMGAPADEVTTTKPED